MTINEAAFQERFDKLNENQREAVETIYGPVMVIAGPGTGKTEVLAMRIANLMKSEAQVQPHEILCLTYTDEATNSMRRRLVQVIGTAAHKVNIFTFHAFCNNIIQAHSEYFSLRTLQPITDLERTELMYGLIDSLPSGHLLRRLSGGIYTDVPRLLSLFELMKRENYSPKEISEHIDAYLASLPENPEYIYKKKTNGFEKGQPKQDKIDEETKRMETTRAAAQLLDVYEKHMRDLGRYDFSDMILWVLKAFEEQPWLLQTYQERFQFILVDEFQDTNGAQNDLLKTLTSYWEDPNIFVVGDDDQSIFEFQGARIRNIVDFYDRHRESIKVVILPHNYRSSQEIIDKAMASIKNNGQRLINQIEDIKLEKNIVAANSRFTEATEKIHPVVKMYPCVLQEETDVVNQIIALRDNNVPLNEIAILYAQHKQVANIIDIFEKKGIPFDVKRPANILELPVIEQILSILKYLDLESKKPFSGEDLLFTLLHCPWTKIVPSDLGLVALRMQSIPYTDTARKWKLSLSNEQWLRETGLKNAQAILKWGRLLETWETELTTMPVLLLLEKVLYEGGIVQHEISRPDKIWRLQVLNTFFDFVKDSLDRNAKLNLSTLLKMVERMNDEHISLPVHRVVQSDRGVKLYTAHSSKGNEFEHVFLIGCTKNFWEKKAGNNRQYKLPENLVGTENDERKVYKEEEARRLFFVALTRAKKHLTISYSSNDNAGKALEVSQFVDEICEGDEAIKVAVTDDPISSFIQTTLQPVKPEYFTYANEQWIDRALQQFTMSATSLSRYLRCPLEFYFAELLRVPSQKSDALAFGTAIHAALERFYKEMKVNGDFPPKESLLEWFKYALNKDIASFTQTQLDRRMEQGLTVLAEFYDENIDKLQKNVEIEYKVPRYILEGVPVTAKIDRIEKDGVHCRVFDYKTGKPENNGSKTSSPNDKNPNGGDYWRQMFFYKIVLEHMEENPWIVDQGTFEFVQKLDKGGYKNYTIPFFEHEQALVMQQIKDTYSNIMRKNFDHGCGEAECQWCNFAKNYELLRPSDETEMDD